jgi:Methyltransferase domain
MYVSPRVVTDPNDCRWYHTMDLPEIGTVHGQWDLRPTMDDYLGQFDFTGLRCLDIGTASGALTWAMEARGAREVVSMDLDHADRRDLVPFVQLDLEASRAVGRRNFPKFQAGYWLAHRLLRSRARVYYGSGYDLPAGLGQFDVVMLGMMLPHVENPFRVLEQAAARSDKTIIVTQQAPCVDEAFAYWMPNADRPDPQAWWSLSEICVERMLGVLGFSVVRRVRAEHLRSFDGVKESCTATVAERVLQARAP